MSYSPAHASFLEGAKRRTQGDNRDDGDECAHYPNHHDIQMAFAMRRAADGEQRHDRAIVRQAVKGARADCGDPMHQSRVDTLLNRDTTRLSRNRGGDKRRGTRQWKYVPAATSQPKKSAQPKQDV
jgi:hypothetical protein